VTGDPKRKTNPIKTQTKVPIETFNSGNWIGLHTLYQAAKLVA